MEPNPWLVTSSLSFLLPCALCYVLNLPVLSAIYGLVTCVTSIYHATKHPTLVWADFALSQLSHVMTVSYIVQGGWVSMPAYAVWLTYTLLTYYGGYATSTLIWDLDRTRATPWHILLHVSTSATTLYTVFVTWVSLQAGS